MTATTYSHNDLMDEILAEYKELNGVPVKSRSVLVAAVLKRWLVAPTERDAWFRMEVVSRGVRELIRSIKLREEGSDVGQSDLPEVDIFPGYSRLQQEYCIKRNGELCIVALSAMTAEEGISKARTMERNATGLMEHADELRRFFNG